MEYHPLANLFPLMSDEDVEVLGRDMLKHGQLDVIWTYEGKILDGRNRERACLLKNIEPRYAEFRGADPLGFVVSMNLHRRELNAGQRALVVETLANMRQGERTDLEPSAMIAKCDQATAAKLGKVSPRTLSTAMALKRDGIPAVVDAVKRGEVPIARAAAFANTVPSLDQARLIAEHGSPADAVNATIKAKANRAQVKRSKQIPGVKKAADRAEQRARAVAPEQVRDQADRAAGRDLCAVAQFAEFCRVYSPVTFVSVLLTDEVADVKSDASTIDKWMSLLSVHLDQREKRAWLR